MAAHGYETAVRAATTAQDRTPTRMGPSATPRPSRAARAIDQPADRQQCDQQSARVVANPSDIGRDVIAGHDITVSGTRHGDGPDGRRGEWRRTCEKGQSCFSKQDLGGGSRQILEVCMHACAHDYRGYYPDPGPPSPAQSPCLPLEVPARVSSRGSLVSITSGKQAAQDRRAARWAVVGPA